MTTIRDQGFQVVIDPGEWYRLKKDLDRFDPALSRALRKRLREAGQVAANAVKESLREPSPGGGDDSGEGRRALAAATKVSVSFGKRSAGTKIVTSASKLPPENQGLLHVYNKTEFRHPLFGDKNQWFRQKGNPYFETAIQKAINAAMVREVWEAIDDAERAIGARGI